MWEQGTVVYYNLPRYAVGYVAVYLKASQSENTPMMRLAKHGNAVIANGGEFSLLVL